LRFIWCFCDVVSMPISVLFSYEIKRYKTHFSDHREREEETCRVRQWTVRMAVFLINLYLPYFKILWSEFLSQIFSIHWLYFPWPLDDISTKCFSVLLACLEAFLSVSSTFTFTSIQVLVFFTDIGR